MADRTMRLLSVIGATGLSFMLWGLPGTAQEGHPLKGSWLGTWGPSEHHNDDVLVVMDWDGRTITGTINPGTDDIPITNATLDPEGWVLRFEAETMDRSGNPLKYVIEGTIENLAMHNRSILGAWRTQGERGPFEIRRQ